MKRQPKFQVFKGTSGQWHWRLRASNGEVIAQGEGYSRRAGALSGIRAVRRAAAVAEVSEL